MTQRFPLLPLRDIVVFPGMVVPIFVGRDRSVAALEAAMEGEKDVFLLAQIDPACEEPDGSDLYDIGVVAQLFYVRLSRPLEFGCRYPVPHGGAVFVEE